MASDGTSSSTNYANYKPSALFNAFDTVMQALDQPTYKSSVSAFAKFVTDKDHFLYADFQLSYDPCTCFWEQGLQVSFAGIQTGHLTLTGRYEGIQSSDPAILNIDNGAGTVFGQSALQNYLASVLNDGYDGSDIIATEKTVDNTIQDIAKQYLDASARASEAVVIGTMFTAVSGAAGIISGIPSTTPPTTPPAAPNNVTDNATIAGTVKDAASSAATAVNLLSVGLTPNTQTSVMFGGLALKGTDYQSTPLNGVEFSLATPGSSNASARPEYAPAAAGGALPNAPIYNEIPGLIALKQTPTVKRFKGLPTALTTFGPFFYFDQTVQGEAYTSRPFEYQFDESSLQILYSPFVNASTTQIYAALEIEGIPLVSTTQVVDPGGEVLTVGPGFFLGGLTNMTDITGTTKAVSDSNRTYITDFVPVSCLGRVIGQEMVDFNGIQVADVNYILGSSPSSLANRKVTLVLQVYFEFNQNSYGKTKRTFQILKFPVNINDVSSALSTQPSFAAEQGIPTDLALSALPTTIPANNIIYSKGTITISGNLTLPSGHAPITIRAQNEIDVLPGVEIGPGITLEIQSFLPICDDFSSAAVTPATVDNTFCNSSNYQANQYIASKRNLLDTTQRLFTSNFALRLYPNPSTDICHMVFTMSSSATASADLIDMTGRLVRPIMSGSYAQGPSRIDFSTADIAPGAYMVRYIDGNGNTANKSLVVSHGEK
jgi:hypothetical protein